MPSDSEPEKIDANLFIKDHELLSVPRDLIGTESAVLEVLSAIGQALGETVEVIDQDGEESEYTLSLATETIKRAFQEECLSLEQVQEILNLPVDYRAIHQMVVEEDFTASLEDIRIFQDAYFIDAVLFALELRNPKKNHLRCNRKKYDIQYFANTLYANTPEPKVSTILWEKKLRSDKQFIAEFQETHESVSAYTSRWMIIASSDTGFQFIAFDEDGEINRKVTEFLTYKIQCETDSGDDVIQFPVGRFMIKYNLDMLGTPLYQNSPDGCEPACHLLAQQVSVKWDNNAYQVRIPSFYNKTSMAELLNADFYELNLAISGDLNFGGNQTINNAKIEKAHFKKGSMRQIIGMIYQALKQESYINPPEAVWLTAKAISTWYPSNHNDGLNSIITNGGITIPKNTYTKKAKEYYEKMTVMGVLNYVAPIIERQQMPDSKRYLFDKFYTAMENDSE